MPFADTQKTFVAKSEEDKQLPKWLVEFESFPKDPTAPEKLRPMTDRLNRPKWFEELSQKRRMSDISNLNYMKSIHFKEHPQHHQYNFESPISPEGKSLKLQLPSERRKSSSEYMSVDSKPNSSRNSSSNSSKTSSNLNDFPLDDDDIFAFSTMTKSIENLKLDDSSHDFEDEFIIPEMPSGSELTLILLNNWGDENYIGFNGVEILDPSGNRPKIKSIHLEDNCNDRFTVPELKKLVDNVYRTHDERHIWQYRMSRKQLPLRIVFQFEKPITVALMRIWNFNKSRCHSYRGLKYVRIRLNEKVIFSGEIAKATGDLTGSVENFGDTILFTTDEGILEQISQFDLSFQELLRRSTE